MAVSHVNGAVYICLHWHSSLGSWALGFAKAHLGVTFPVSAGILLRVGLRCVESEPVNLTLPYAYASKYDFMNASLYEKVPDWHSSARRAVVCPAMTGLVCVWGPSDCYQ